MKINKIFTLLTLATIPFTTMAEVVTFRIEPQEKPFTIIKSEVSYKYLSIDLKVAPETVVECLLFNKKGEVSSGDSTANYRKYPSSRSIHIKIDGIDYSEGFECFSK